MYIDFCTKMDIHEKMLKKKTRDECILFLYRNRRSDTTTIYAEKCTYHRSPR